VSGVDVAEQMLEIARAEVPNGSFALADVQAGLLYADASFDAVAGNMVVHHFARPSLALAHLARVLRPGGRLGLTMWDPPADNPALGIFNDAVEAAGASQPLDIPVLPDRPDDSSFDALLVDAGLHDVEVSHVQFEFVSDPVKWWDAVVSSTALTAAVVNRQPADTQQRIRAAYDELVRRYVDHSGQARFPASATLAVAAR
jgi:SAM-dependent methyltransferase